VVVGCVDQIVNTYTSPSTYSDGLLQIEEVSEPRTGVDEMGLHQAKAFPL
jgi:hypothetical protein